MRLPISFFLVILLLLVPNAILAQEKTGDETDVVADTSDEDNENDAEAVEDRAVVTNNDRYRQMFAAKQFQLIQFFAVEVDEITRVCQLDKAQVAKLTVGAKGSVKKLMEDWEKIAGPQFGEPIIARDNVDENDVESDAKSEPVEDAVDVKITDADQLDDSARDVVMMGNDRNPFKFDPPNGDEFWKNVLVSVLTESQSAQLDQFRQNRDREKRLAMIDLCLGTLNIELGLTDEQHEKLSVLITPVMENADVRCNVFFEPYVFYYYASTVDENRLGEFLSVAQLQKWKLFMTPAIQLERLMEIEAQGDEALQKQTQTAENDEDQ